MFYKTEYWQFWGSLVDEIITQHIASESEQTVTEIVDIKL